MNTESVKMIGENHEVVAIAQVDQRGEVFSGTIHLDSLPISVRRMFEEFEELVNGQMFSLLDDVQDRIDGLLWRVKFADGVERAIADLQIFPSTQRVSFKLATPAPLMPGFPAAAPDSSILPSAPRC